MKGLDWSTTEFFIVCLYLGLFVSFPSAHADEEEVIDPPSAETEEEAASAAPNKLLVIMLDGFRWDYYDRQKNELRGFSQFLSEGVQVKWVEPVFPSLSYPTWTTISTGVWPETHGIIGNYMYDLKNDVGFDLNNSTTTSMVHWWQNSEPIWTTATRFKKKTFLKYWSRCDVPFNEIKIETCTGYHSAPGIKPIEDVLKLAVQKLQEDFDLVMVYGEHIDNIGHQFGPESPEIKEAIRDVDNLLYDFLDMMVDSQLDDKVNVVILGDHGMKWTGEGSDVVYVNLEDYLSKKDVFKVLETGAVISIAPFSKRLEEVYDKLKGKEGFHVYKRKDIPDEYHYRKARLVQDLLVVAHPNYYVRGIPGGVWSGKQNSQKMSGGTHGYPNMTEMRTIFFAKGPDFKKGIIHPPIDLVDIYQIFAKVLDIQAQPHNGSWDKVSDMLTSKAPQSSFNYSLCILAASLTFFTTISVTSHHLLSFSL